ncbi:formate dehydrogenase accessory sulfurtransferase FdhD [Bradyrhizobium symbiodeficiens]|uniref:Formate dehydrogenase accessory sulfurtransferase FdhD n=1 Tax=Bradyrhizobium symbiodeficiens TaxID=1404367 RepID=A0AAJ6MMK2_9BRAD|nr:formate dehydrogenase accessory sulfurtransferase FdhD [Bradyrhizobium symbiodeficiens]
MMGGSTFTRHREIAWRGGRTTPTSRLVAEESAVALTYNGSVHAVMMGTPADLEDFGVGFSLTEGIIGRASEIGSIELISNELGMEVRMWLDGDRASTLAAWLSLGVFASSQTANDVFLGIHALSGQWQRALSHLLPLAAFLLGRSL